MADHPTGMGPTGGAPADETYPPAAMQAYRRRDCGRRLTEALALYRIDMHAAGTAYRLGYPRDGRHNEAMARARLHMFPGILDIIEAGST